MKRWSMTLRVLVLATVGATALISLVCTYLELNAWIRATATPDVEKERSVLIQFDGIPWTLAADDRQLFWSSLGRRGDAQQDPVHSMNGQLLRVDKDGSQLTIMASGLYPPLSIVTDDVFLYWIGADGIKKMPKEGGTITSLITWPPLVNRGSKLPGLYLASDRTDLFWSSCDESTVWKVDKSGNKATSLYQLGNQCAWHLVADGEFVYWIDSRDNGSIMRSNKDGSQIDQVLRDLGTPKSLLVEDGVIYWTNVWDIQVNNHGTVKRLNSIGMQPTLLADNQHYPERLLSDRTDLYWLDGLEVTQLRKVSKNGGMVTTVTSNTRGLRQIINDGKVIYATVPGEGHIVALDK